MEREFHFFVEPETYTEESESEGSTDGSADGTEDASDDSDSEGRSLIVRLDKWLWAARFFKTRALARAAVEAGKVFYNGERSKPSREIEVGAILQIRHGRFEKTVEVKGLSTRRRSTEEALQLFEETEESKFLREQQTGDFSQNHYNQPHASYHQPYIGQSQDTRPNRFLRRPSFMRQGQDPQQQNIRHQESRVPHRPQRSTQPQHNTGYHQPYHNSGYNTGYHNTGYNQPYHNHQHNGHGQPPHHPNQHYPQSGYNNTGYPQQNDNNPVYGPRQNHAGYNSGHHNAYHNPYHNARNNHSSHHPQHSVPKNKTEPQTEYE